ncbi:hypothetical protein HYY70_03535 [Candidatus Woesearchaeota archaeon]|nr:hypothetical protein [Candidatus Woesearchaeota archaeon]
MEHTLKCPNCGRNLTENELYCYFCEIEISKLKIESTKNKNKIKTKK